ncbi:MAG: hypothetical protein KJT03_03355 [Verrucomicrobiae bacterium]|nr:hypothetical protein [Verrucomicrobiae bacterium]
MSLETISLGDLTASFVDNAEHGVHRAGYNGIASLRHRTSTRNLFVDKYAGLNLEHIFSGVGEDNREVFFEPRYAPMELKRISDDTVELYQPPTPTFHLVSWTRFQVVAPHYIDMTFTCRATQHSFHYGYIGLFWASYINAPLDKSMYFRGGLEGQESSWQQLVTHRHNDESTVRHKDDNFRLQWEEDSRDTLYKNLSPLRYHLPFFYGNFEDLTWAVMFDRHDIIRLTHSPSGGGLNAERQTTNPAWDFQFIIPGYDVATDYSFRVRAFLQPRITRQRMMEEYEAWREMLQAH